MVPTVRLPLLALILAAGCFSSGDEDEIDLDLDPAPAAGVDPETVVLFAVHSANVLVPLACMNPAWSSSKSGTPCLDLLPEGHPDIDVGKGATVNMHGRTSVQCLSGRAKSGIDVSPMVEAWPVVTWSTGPVPWCDFAKAGPGETLDPALEGALQRTAATLDLGLEPPPSDQITIQPIYRVDLDGDGELDHIAKAIWPEPEPPPAPDAGAGTPPPPPPPQQEMLVLLGGYQAMRFDMPLPQLVELTGAIDLDYDGRCELVVAAERDDGSSVALARWAGTRVELVTAHECGI